MLHIIRGLGGKSSSKFPTWPHIHIRCGEGECECWLEPIGLASNRGISAHRLNEIERLVFEHQILLTTKYHERRDQQS